jgi:regulator of cell morphogenesis and NO signaling
MSTSVAPARILVCHELPPRDRLAALLASFDALAPGESLELRSDHAPRPALGHLHKERPAGFEWSPLEEGPKLWRTEITRREPGRGRREVSEALAWDHDRLDALESAAWLARAAADAEQAGRLFHDFAHGLRRHIAFEEQLVFPAFEARAGELAAHGPTRVMRQEHLLIKERLGELERGFTRLAEPLQAARENFHAVMREHNLKEERVLYPAIDQMLSEPERDELVARVQAFVER